MIHILNDKYCLLEDVLPLIPGRRTELDLGCGKGRFSVELAARYPEALIMGADVMLGRLRRVEKKAKKNGVENLQLLRVEARHLLTIILPDNALDRLHILCPDPWPKHKHKGNRLISSDIMTQIARVLKPSGIFHFATDDPRYMAAALGNIQASGLFEEVSNNVLNDVADIKTEFEMDWLAIGRTVPHKAFRKI